MIRMPKRQLLRWIGLLFALWCIRWWYRLQVGISAGNKHDFLVNERGAKSFFGDKQLIETASVKDTLKERCSHFNLTGQKLWGDSNKNHYFHFFLVFDKFKTIYCYVPKAGSTAWKAVIANASGFRREDFKHLEQAGRPEVWIHDAIYAKYPRLGTFSEKEIEYRLKNYFKFTVVRNPMDRLLSTYMDKFYTVEHDGTPRTPPYIHYAEKIKRYASLRKHKLRNRSDKIEFIDFIRYISHFGQSRNEHWETYDNLCHPCAINYDFIGKVETMLVDQSDILKGMNLAHMKLPVEHRVKHKSFLDYYKDVDEEDLAALKKAYELDFSLFSY